MLAILLMKDRRIGGRIGDSKGDVDMRKVCVLVAAAALALQGGSLFAQSKTQLGFFITSVGSGDGANLGGLAGADAHCQKLAAAAGAGDRTWRAYLSGTENGKPVNARDRIGTGPWFNAKGVQVAANLEELHSEAAKTGKEGSLTEKGEMVPGRGDKPNEHDILTGSQQDGTAFTGGEDLTCNNWTSNSTGSAQVGHHDRQGGGANPTSWNSAHASKGCSQENLIATGGAGYFYCFAAK
jgi:hypothetical protein